MSNRFVNKGNYSLEPQDRELAFEQRRGAGWEKEYQDYREKWQTRPAQRDPGEWPLLIDLELSSLCSLKCPMCYTITDEFKTKVRRGFMPFDIFRRIVDEIAGNVPALRLSLRGESSLHPRFFDCIRYAKNAGIGEISFLTTLGVIPEARMEELVLSGADWITVSIDGMRAMYESIRKPLRFMDTVKRLERIRTLREEHALARPAIKVQSIWPAIKENFDEFYDFFSSRVDYVAFNPLIDYLRSDSTSQIMYVPDFLCPMLYQRIVVLSNGDVVPCSNDERESMPVGNADMQSIAEIWHGEALRKIRLAHEKPDGFRQFAACAQCYLPREIEDELHRFSNGREFVVKNYINRMQVIGL
jgi:radical SAM protein with 4Fe4S-binding SPASM domain